ncbi:hypothetical protein BN10_1600019 [Phycicoccus elongatus Lp2]|uniref:Pyridoxamine 5'-phosphate oxidase putative domain-containing protein n=1 Tax=Phycicoccus elongatus Lp2 TaxID=1193181 RepID=N0E118_9MICO|nr:hypothetical protein BN10_1600019 [Phycicoccus elongatus Lp2]
MSLADEQFIALTTYRRTGAPVPTPVWVVPVMRHGTNGPVRSRLRGGARGRQGEVRARVSAHDQAHRAAGGASKGPALRRHRRADHARAMSPISPAPAP